MNNFLKNYKDNISIYVSKFKLKEKVEIILSKNVSYLDDEKKPFTGLKEFEVSFIKNKPIYIFDNHNFASFSFLESKEFFGKKLDVVHIDAHRDNAIFQYPVPKNLNWKNLNEYLKKSRISDYLDLAVKANLIGKIYNITQSWEFENFEIGNNDFILNLDIDIFGDDGGMVEDSLKKEVIKKAWNKAKVICIATSPGFINQEKAKKEILNLIDDI